MLLAFLWAGLSLAGAFSEPAFVGAARCRLCHRDVYQSWKTTPHARASLEIPESETRCVECHATDGRDLPDVQCEACHGAGGNYWPAEVMMDPDKAQMAGLVRPDEALCRSCHENDEPGHEGTFTMPGPAELPDVVHRMPEP